MPTTVIAARAIMLKKQSKILPRRESSLILIKQMQKPENDAQGTYAQPSARKTLCAVVISSVEPQALPMPKIIKNESSANTTNIAETINKYLFATDFLLIILHSTVKTERLFIIYYLFFILSAAAVTKPLNNGCGLLGLLLNSGWNWQATNHGCSGISTISTM